MNLPIFITIAIYAFVSLVYLLFARRARAVKCVLVASYCGVIVISFTGGASGAVWLAPIFLMLVSPVVLFGREVPAFASRTAAQLTLVMFALFFVGILVGLVRFDPLIEDIKAGTFTTLMGIPIRFLMAGYRAMLLVCLVLAFSLPLRYRIDREVFGECLMISWFFSTVLAIFGVLNTLGWVDVAFSYRHDAGYRQVSVLGFHRAALGMMSVAGIFQALLLVQIMQRPLRSILIYASAPLLLLALLLTWSRAAVLALVAGIVTLTFVWGWSRAWKGIVLTLGGVATAVVMMAIFPELQDRFRLPGQGLTVEETSAGRFPAWAGLLTWLLRRPDVLVFGAGFQNFHYFVNLSAGAITLESAHNNFLHILTEGGIFVFLLFLSWLAALFAWLWSWRKHRARLGRTVSQSAIAGVVLALMVAVVVSCLTQESLSPSSAMTPFVLHFYLLLGLFMSFYRNEAAEPDSEFLAQTSSNGR